MNMMMKMKIVLFLQFDRNEFLRTGCPLLRSAWFSCSLPEAHASVVVHGVDLNFISITFRAVRDSDFQYWANFCISSNPPF